MAGDPVPPSVSKTHFISELTVSEVQDEPSSLSVTVNEKRYETRLPSGILMFIMAEVESLKVKALPSGFFIIRHK